MREILYFVILIFLVHFFLEFLAYANIFDVSYWMISDNCLEGVLGIQNC